MGSNFNDDEPITAILASNSGPAAEGFISGKSAALGKSEYGLIVELMGLETWGQRCGVDIVTVLDMSDSMSGEKLEKVKTSMKFLVKKLSPIDRLSIVTFSTETHRLCPLIRMHKNAQVDVEMLIDNLRASGGTNIPAGLQTAFQVLAERRQKQGRTSAIMLMSDGQESSGLAKDVFIYTFGLRNDDHDNKVAHLLFTRLGWNSIHLFRPSDEGELFEAHPLFTAVTRTNSPAVVEPTDLTSVVAQGDTTDARKEAKERANNDSDGANKETLKESEKPLNELNHKTYDLTKVQEFFKLHKDPETYRSFALSSELSYELQRFAARGDATQLLAIIIPLVIQFANQSEDFDQNIIIDVTSAEEEKSKVKEIIKALEPLPDSLNLHIAQAIGSLTAIQDTLIASQRA